MGQFQHLKLVRTVELKLLAMKGSLKAVPWCYYVGTLQTGTETDALIHFIWLQEQTLL